MIHSEGSITPHQPRLSSARAEQVSLSSPRPREEAPYLPSLLASRRRPVALCIPHLERFVAKTRSTTHPGRERVCLKSSRSSTKFVRRLIHCWIRAASPPPLEGRICRGEAGSKFGDLSRD